MIIPDSFNRSLSSTISDCSTTRSGSWNREGKKEAATLLDVISHLCGKQVPGLLSTGITLSGSRLERINQIIQVYSMLLAFLR